MSKPRETEALSFAPGLRWQTGGMRGGSDRTDISAVQTDVKTRELIKDAQRETARCAVRVNEVRFGEFVPHQREVLSTHLLK